MQGVILAAGRGTRMGELSRAKPKPLLDVAGKTLLEHHFDALEGVADEIIIVIGYLGDQIKMCFGNHYQGIKLLYVEQKELNGTAGALWQARPLLHNSFLVMYADNIYFKEDVIAVSCNPWSVAGVEVDSLGGAARMIVNDSDRVMDILEVGERDESPGFLNTGLYCLDMRVFDCKLVPKSRGSKEFGLPQTLMKAAVPLLLVRTKFWIEITSPGDLETAAKLLKKRHN